MTRKVPLEVQILTTLWLTPISKSALEVLYGDVKDALDNLIIFNMIGMSEGVFTVSCTTGSGKNKKSVETIEEVIDIFKKRKKVARTFASYKTYDDRTEERGSAGSWRKAAQSLLGILVNDSVYFRILGFDKKPETLKELRRGYLNLLKKEHPDVGGDPRKAEQIVNAYQIVKKLY